MSDTTPTKRPVFRILESRLVTADYASVVYCLEAPAGSQPDDFLEPEAYAHVTRKLGAGSRLEITAADGTWYA